MILQEVSGHLGILLCSSLAMLGLCKPRPFHPSVTNNASATFHSNIFGHLEAREEGASYLHPPQLFLRCLRFQRRK